MDKLELRTKLLTTFPWLTIQNLADIFSVADKNQRTVFLGVLRFTHKPLIIGGAVRHHIVKHTCDVKELEDPRINEFLMRRFNIRPHQSLEQYQHLLHVGCSGLCHNPDTLMSIPYISLIFKAVSLTKDRLQVHAQPNLVIATISATDTGYRVHKELACNTL